MEQVRQFSPYSREAHGKKNPTQKKSSFLSLYAGLALPDTHNDSGDAKTAFEQNIEQIRSH